LKILDAFCGAGGAAVGYAAAGFEVIGVDIAAQPNYPYEFHQGDAIEFIATHGGEFAAIHASPPCQASSALTKGTNRGRTYEQLIPQTREALSRFDVPTVLENVAGAQISKDLTLCGEMFGLNVIRHRFFELEGWNTDQPRHVPHRGRVAGWRHGEFFDGPYVAVYGEGGGKGSVPQWQNAMGIYHTDVRKEIAEAIPPAYTRFIGSRLAALLSEQASYG